jgi:hypothetical protein
MERIVTITTYSEFNLEPGRRVTRVVAGPPPATSSPHPHWLVVLTNDGADLSGDTTIASGDQAWIAQPVGD